MNFLVIVSILLLICSIVTNDDAFFISGFIAACSGIIIKELSNGKNSNAKTKND